MRYRGLTWDHPRGYNALAAAAATLDPEVLGIDWDVQPLEGFESAPIADLCARYDLVVMDHPHLGEAMAHGCLTPLEDVFGASFIEALKAETVGPCLSSYRWDGRHYALPLDAATQVAAYRPDRLERPPASWDDVRALAKEGGVVLSLGGPHALLSFLSLASALDPSPREARFLAPGVGEEAFARLAEIAAHGDRALAERNPIGILEAMCARDDVFYCPLVYGYVTYSARPDGARVAFANAPTAGGRHGSVLGGTGIALSARCQPSPELIAHLAWLLGETAQTGFIPAHDGQPSRRSAWRDTAVNGAAGNFYRDTLATVEAATVRPRHDGFIAFQTAASASLRAAIDSGEAPREAAAAVERLYTASLNRDSAPQ